MSYSNNISPYDHPFNVGLRQNSSQFQKTTSTPPSLPAQVTASKSASYGNSLIEKLGHLYQMAPVGTVRSLLGAAAGYALTGSGIGTLICAAAGYCLPSIIGKLSEQPQTTAATPAPKKLIAAPISSTKTPSLAPTTPNGLLVPFYQGNGVTASSAGLEQILSWNDQRLEAQHDYIQWLFPLASASRYNPNAPVLDHKLQNSLRTDPVVQKNYLRAFDRMLKFYGFNRNQDGSITPAANFAARFKEWGTPNNHNFLRITRILTSLKLMGHATEAARFFQALQSYTNGVEPRTVQIWRNTQH